uniref:Helicase n=1 Tax=viral metagenome TaxID=1070528 RepID=A0A6C0JMI9_9ZZZZ
MVKICDQPYPCDHSLHNDSTLQSHFESFSFPLSDFQKYAIEAIVTGNHVLVTAHTGSGKTLPAEFAIQHFVGQGKKVIYTSPIKALSNQKFYEFTNKYPHISFGLMTGDIKTNPNADVLIMTTEILMNYLFLNDANGANNNSRLDFQINVQTELGCVIFDEVHYINDADRGQVWEKTILMLPEHIQMVMLSATIDNPEGFAKWCERNSTIKEVWLASTNHRVVPLSHYGFLTTTESIFKIVKNKETEKYVRDKTNMLIPLQSHKGQFEESGFRDLVRITELFETNRLDMKRKHVINQLALHLRDRDMLPAIAFVFSRKHVELCAQDLTIPLLEDDSKVGYTIRRECEQIIRKLPNYQEYLALPEYNRLVGLLEKGIGIHHSGMIPVLREIVELMISKKYIKMLFATESFAIGLDCPIRTAVFTSLTKFDGNGPRYLMAHEYTQMAGRAGRRGIDTVGHVVHCNNLFKVPTLNDYKTIMGGVPQKLVSKYHISYGLVLNLLQNGAGAISVEALSSFSEKSMVFQEIKRDASRIRSNIEVISQKIQKKTESIELARTPNDVCLRYVYLEKLLLNSVNKKRKEITKEMETLKDQYRYLTSDYLLIKELEELTSDYNNDMESLDYVEDFIHNQTKKICQIMIEDGFIESIESGRLYDLTRLGKIASGVAEIHPLCLATCLRSWNNFDSFSVRQLIGLFSCFTDVKVSEEYRMSRPSIDDAFLQHKIMELKGVYEKYETRENELDVRTGIRYEDALMFDLIESSMSWSTFTSDTECKYFIQGKIHELGISIGDFNKAMLKVVTISKEWIKVFEELGEISIVHKLTQIEGLILKYVTTSQSLYV